MKYHLVYNKVIALDGTRGFCVKDFDSKLDCLKYIAENRISHLGSRNYACIEGGNWLFGGPEGLCTGDIYNEIEKLEAKKELADAKA